MVRTKKRYGGTRHSAAKTRNADLISERRFRSEYGQDALDQIQKTWRDPASDHELIIQDYADKHKKERINWGSQFGLPWTHEQSVKARESVKAPESVKARESVKAPESAPLSISAQMSRLSLTGGTKRRKMRSCHTRRKTRSRHTRRK
jgi:hypothetical protein